MIEGAAGPGRTLAAADLFFLPSSQESFGLGALEAMACGVPVLASRAGGLPEVVDDGETGLLFEPHDVDGFAAASLELLRDDARRQTMGAAARERAINLFSPDIVVPRYEDYYRRVLEERKG